MKIMYVGADGCAMNVRFCLGVAWDAGRSQSGHSDSGITSWSLGQCSGAIFMVKIAQRYHKICGA